jgi:beta-1,4-N-acetylglucosaminyltransferase
VTELSLRWDPLAGGADGILCEVRHVHHTDMQSRRTFAGWQHHGSRGSRDGARPATERRSPKLRERGPEADRVPSVALVCSSGGHLAHLLVLRPWWSRHQRLWVTFDKPDARAALEGEKVYYCHFPTNRNLPNLVRNTLLAFRVLRRERPSLIVSSGAAVAVPFFALAKLFGARTMYIEVVDRVDTPTLTARLVRPFVDCFVAQWPEQAAFHPRAVVIGRLL